MENYIYILQQLRQFPMWWDYYFDRSFAIVTGSVAEVCERPLYVTLYPTLKTLKTE